MSLTILAFDMVTQLNAIKSTLNTMRLQLSARNEYHSTGIDDLDVQIATVQSAVTRITTLEINIVTLQNRIYALEHPPI